MKYVLVELQTSKDGGVANIVTAYDGRAQAESAYHSVLSAAAVSGLPAHAAVLMTGEGSLVAAQCYREGEPDAD